MAYSTPTEAQKQLLTEMMMKYWNFDTLPDFDTIVPNSIEDLTLEMYDSEKKSILASYPWRSAIKYVTITGTEPTSNDDERYKYRGDVPEDFLKEVGFWMDSYRRNKLTDSCEILGRELKSSIESVVMGYVADIDEEDFDLWFSEYFIIQLAANLAAIGGQSVESKAQLAQLAVIEQVKAQNKDYEMTHKDEISNSIHQFEWF